MAQRWINPYAIAASLQFRTNGSLYTGTERSLPFNQDSGIRNYEDIFGVIIILVASHLRVAIHFGNTHEQPPD